MTTEEPANYGAWWEGFDDGVLNTLIDTAYNENLTLQVAAIRVLEARARLGVARGLRAPQKQELGGQAVRVELSENGPNLVIAAIDATTFEQCPRRLWPSLCTAR